MGPVKHSLRAARLLSKQTVEQRGPVVVTAGEWGRFFSAHTGAHLLPICLTGVGWGGGMDLGHSELPFVSKSPPTSLTEYLGAFPLASALIIEATPGLNSLACRNAFLYMPVDPCSTNLSVTLFTCPLLTSCFHLPFPEGLPLL